MEAFLLNSSADQSISPYKHQIRNPGKNNRPLISRPYENFAPTNFHGGLLYTPPPSLSYSFPPSVAVLPQRHHQPPLLPLPILNPQNHNFSRSRGLSCPPINRKIKNRTRDQSLTPKKSKKPSTKDPKKEDPPTKTEIVKEMSSEKCLMVASTNRLGPDPKDLPMEVQVSKVLSAPSSLCNNTNNTKELVDKFSGSVVFTLSPPPSSLPLPTFSLRPKLSCNAEAAGIDTGATDNLRRLLRLR